MEYDDWLTEQIIKHGVTRPHKWENHEGHSYKAIPVGHWVCVASAELNKAWTFTQKAVDYLKEKQYNGNPINENRSGKDE